MRRARMKKDHDCNTFLESLSEYVDGVLDSALCKEIEDHIADCDDCRVVVDTFKKTIYLYHKISEKRTMPAEVRERLFHRLDLDDFVQEKTVP